MSKPHHANRPSEPRELPDLAPELAPDLTPEEIAMWRLLPSEQVIWQGGPANVAHAKMWRWASVLLIAMSIVSLCFAFLLSATEQAGMHQAVGFGTLLAAGALAAFIWPRHRLENVAYLLTDRRVLWRRGKRVRSIEKHSITYAKIRWHAEMPVVGHLELVVATPFGPLRRSHRVTLENVREPDLLWARIREMSVLDGMGDGMGDGQQPLVERLDPNEQIVWSGRPAGLHLGVREWSTAAGGLLIAALGVAYGHQTMNILLDLESLGLQVRSVEWMFLFLAVTLSWVSIEVVGVFMMWYGIVRARRLGVDTEYVLTDSRLILRRGTMELLLDRKHIVDVALRPILGGLSNLFLVLDGPGSRALADNGAMAALAPARDTMPAVLFELSDAQSVRQKILGEA